MCIEIWLKREVVIGRLTISLKLGGAQMARFSVSRAEMVKKSTETAEEVRHEQEAPPCRSEAQLHIKALRGHSNR